MCGIPDYTERLLATLKTEWRHVVGDLNALAYALHGDYEYPQNCDYITVNTVVFQTMPQLLPSGR